MIKAEDIVLDHVDDSHVYTVNGKYFPGVTQILDLAAPKHPSLIKFFQNNSANRIKKIKNNSSSFGTNCHQAIEKIINKDDFSIDQYSESEKSVIVQFLSWYKFFQPLNPKSEQFVAYDDREIRFAGTLDLFAEISTDKLHAAGLIRKQELNSLWKVIIDFKSSKDVYLSHKIQLIAYKAALEQMTGESIDGIAVVKLSENGFETHLIDDVVKFEHFKAVYSLYKLLLGGDIPHEYHEYLNKKSLAGF
jgi:hypothetical protein